MSYGKSLSLKRPIITYTTFYSTKLSIKLGTSPQMLYINTQQFSNIPSYAKSASFSYFLRCLSTILGSTSVSAIFLDNSGVYDLLWT